MRITGSVLKVRPVQGTDEQTGQPYSYQRAVIHDDDDHELYDCKVGPDFGPLTEGEHVEAVLGVSAYRRDGRATVALRLVSRAGALATTKG